MESPRKLPSRAELEGILVEWLHDPDCKDALRRFALERLYDLATQREAPQDAPKPALDLASIRTDDELIAAVRAAVGSA